MLLTKKLGAILKRPQDDFHNLYFYSVLIFYWIDEQEVVGKALHFLLYQYIKRMGIRVAEQSKTLKIYNPVWTGPGWKSHQSKK